MLNAEAAKDNAGLSMVIRDSKGFVMAAGPQKLIATFSPQVAEAFGPLISLRLGFVQTLVVSSAKMAKEVMKTHDLQFCSRPALLGQQTLSYNGQDLVFTPYNDYYKEMRKLCAVHLFNSNRVYQYRPIREDEVSLMIEKISKSVVACKPVNLSELMMSLTSTIICRIGFGKRYGDEGVERSRFHALLNETQAMFDPKRPKSDQEDIIDVLLEMKKQSGFKINLTWDHIKAILMNVFVAGTDTGAATVIWAMTYLMKNPRVMKKVQEEVRNLVGAKGFVDEDDVKRLSYLKDVVKETMRLQPTVPLLVPRETTEKCILEGYEIQAKTLVFVNTWAIGRDPEVWENPEEFYPERFVGSSIDIKGQHFELAPFGAGRRICPGMHMGIATVELALANLLYKFDWEMPVGIKKEDLDFDVLPGITMHKKNVLQLIAKNMDM
ncbi:hypothetical protein EZV62_021269 [Acer yangbiense]|uniref:Cytochrome P450 n=1 Tax=Acer yangbiense TaxID=1000413 RepID=A0A5C7H599_9ROSI|nr:hypothetical protein EZV62_021269 [Acer yangbiense]